MPRLLGPTYKTASSTSHRIRKATTQAVASPISGEGQLVKADETNPSKPKPPFVSHAHQGRPSTKGGKSGGREKCVTAGLVERGGEARAVHVKEPVIASPHLLPNLLLGTVIAVVSGISLYGFLSWVPTFLVKQGLSLGSSLWFSGIMGIGAPLGALLGAGIADRFGRVRSLAALALTEAVLGFIYPHVGTGAELVVIGFAVTLCAYGIVAVGFALYIPELFPTRLRLRGTSVVIGISRLTSSQVGFAIVAIFGTFGIEGVAACLSGAMLLMAITVIATGRETNNRSLEDIETPRPKPLATTRTRSV